jgi:hypothetical protein
MSSSVQAMRVESLPEAQPGCILEVCTYAVHTTKYFVQIVEMHTYYSFVECVLKCIYVLLRIHGIRMF